MVPPEPALAPVILPVIVPMVQAKLLGVLDVSVMFGLVPLQVLGVVELVIAGVGYTVTVIVNAGPAHEVLVAVGVTIYCTLPDAELLGLVNV